jgi:Zn-dependent alcohol dehydrogenase
LGADARAAALAAVRGALARVIAPDAAAAGAASLGCGALAGCATAVSAARPRAAASACTDAL